MSDGASFPSKVFRDTNDWFRIESTAVAALFLFAFLIGPYKRWQTNLAVRFLHTAAAAAAGTMFSQVLGMLNVYDKQAQFYLLWVVFLCVAFDTTVAATAYSIYELSAVRVAFEIGVLANSVDVGVLLGLASFEKFLGPLWALWGLTIAKMLQRVLSFRAAARTYGPENVDLVAHIMSRDPGHKTGTGTSEPEKKSYGNYWVRGEEKVTYTYKELSSNRNLDDQTKIVKIDQVWKCEGRLLKDNVKEEKRRIAMKLKDVCLSFALFKLLRRRFGDYPAEDEEQRSTAKSLVLEKLLLKKDTGEETTPEIKEDDLKRQCTRTFRVIQVELEFLHDLFYTKYPISFYRGISFLNILQMLVIASSVWTTTWVLTGYYENRSSNDTDGHTWNRNHVNVILTFIFTAIVILMELWELSNHVLSNWSKVVATCNYVRHYRSRDILHIDKMVAILGWCGTLWKPLSKKMGQYSLFHAYKSNSIHRNLFKVFIFFMGEAEVGPGAKESPPANVTGDVQYAIFRALRDEGCCISNGERSLRRHKVYEKLFAACNEEDFKRKIMVWHIATSYFELEMANDNNREKKTKKEVGAGEEGSDPYNYSEVAIRLSRYCAYLLLFAPDLLPVNNLVAKLMLEEVVLNARKEFDKDAKCFFDKLMCRDSKEMYEMLKMYVRGPDESRDTEGTMMAASSIPDEINEASIMNQGLKLAKDLVDITEKEQKENDPTKMRWKLLAEFWAEFLLFLAPSENNAMAHLEKLATGGEFITHLWVLLYNAGILERGSSAV